MLMSRSEEKLNKVAAEISKTTYICVIQFSLCNYPNAGELGRESRVIPIDFSDGLEIYKELPKELSDLDIGVLGESLHVYATYISATVIARSQQCWV